MRGILIFLFVLIFSWSYSQEKNPTKEETAKWLKTKIEFNGGRAISYYKADTNNCELVIKEYLSLDDELTNTFTIKYEGLELSKTQHKVNALGVLVLYLYGTVELDNDIASYKTEIELRFTPDNPEDYYQRLMKALTHMKKLCGGVDDELF